MPDVLSTSQRSFCMSRIKSKNTKPEKIVRKLVWNMGYRYRLHCKGLPGRPDMVFAGRKKIIFVHGCFWHMHDCVYGKVVPATNTDFWQKKRLSNVKRDAENYRALAGLGWKTLVVWECWLRDINSLTNSLKDFLGE